MYTVCVSPFRVCTPRVTSCGLVAFCVLSACLRPRALPIAVLRLCTERVPWLFTLIFRTEPVRFYNSKHQLAALDNRTTIIQLPGPDAEPQYQSQSHDAAGRAGRRRDTLTTLWPLRCQRRHNEGSTCNTRPRRRIARADFSMVPKPFVDAGRWGLGPKPPPVDCAAGRCGGTKAATAASSISKKGM